MGRGSSYQPERGHFVYLDFDPQAGHEQAGRRPGLVLSAQRFNVGTGLAMVAPITTKTRGGPFEVAVPPGMKITGAVLVAHARSVDWMVRNMDYAGTAPAELTDEVCGKLAAVIGC